MPTKTSSGTQHQTKRTTDHPGKHDMAWLLDASIPLPGGFRIGLDGLLGLIPGVGDAIGGGLSGWLLYQGYKQNVPKMILARMVLNVVIDAVLGAIPVLGDIFDFFFKANLRNAQLLADYRAAPGETYRRSAVSTAIFFTGVIVIGFVVIWAVVAIFSLLWERLGQGA